MYVMQVYLGARWDIGMAYLSISSVCWWISARWATSLLASDTVSSKAHTVDCNLAQSFSSCCFVSSNLHNYTQECLLVITCMRLFSKYYNCQLPAILGYCMLLAIDSGLATPHLQLMSIKITVCIETGDIGVSSYNSFPSVSAIPSCTKLGINSGTVYCIHKYAKV